jgi:hypothetical protein
VGGISDPGEASSVLDQHVLKAASSPDQQYVPLACFPHDRLGRLRIAVWGAGRNDDRRSSGSDPGGVTNRVGRHDPDLDGDPSMLRRMSKRSESRAIVRVLGRQIH